MIFDFFHSKLNRNDLAQVYSDYHKAVLGFRPEIDPKLGRAQLCNLIEKLNSVPLTSEV